MFNIRMLLAVFLLVFSLNGFVLAKSLAPPTNIRKIEPGYLSLRDAKVAIGFPEKTAHYHFTIGAKFKFAIIDMGFNGIDAWLAANPKEAKNVQYKTARKNKKPSSGAHGFKVFKVARKIMPEAKFLLIELGSYRSDLPYALKLMYDRGVYFASMSLGIRKYFGGEDPSNSVKVLKLLEKYQFTILKSAGNYRQNTHHFPYRDVDKDGRLEFITEVTKKRSGEYNPVYVKKGRPYLLELSWNEWKKRGSDIDLEVVDKKGKIVARKPAEGEDPYILLWVKPDVDGYHYIRVVAKSVARQDDLKFALHVRYVGTRKGYFNGHESTNLGSQYESPFLISVGAFGMGKEGRLEPSLFSSIGHTQTGSVSPHILGPGQLVLNDKKIRGTSYATPFIAALYTTMASYNIKNVIEASTTHGLLKDGLVEGEKSRWGTPEYGRLYTNECTKSNKIENLRHRFTKDKLLLDFDFSRNCMEKLDYYLHITFQGERLFARDAVGIDILKTFPKKGQKPQLVKGWAKKHSKNRNIVKEPVHIEVPLKLFGRDQAGKTVKPVFKIATLAQWDPVAFGVWPVYAIKIPSFPPVSDKYQGAEAFSLAKRMAAGGAYEDGRDLALRALSSNELNKDMRLKAHKVYVNSLIGQKDIPAIIDATQKAMTEGYQDDYFKINGGMGLMAIGRFSEAEKLLHGGLKNKKSPAFYRFCNGYILAGAYQNKNNTTEIAKILGTDVDGLAAQNDIHAVALAILLRKAEPGLLVQKIRSAKGRRNMVLNASRAHFYYGQLALLSGRKDIAKKQFDLSVKSSGIVLERALSDYFLKQLSKK
jgi:hypothetical protein